MNTIDPNLIAVELLTLVLAAGSLLISFGRNRVKKDHVGTLALQAAVELAKRTPDLEEKLRDTIQQLHLAQIASQAAKEKMADMEETMRQQAAQIQLLKTENESLSGQLKQLQVVIQSLQPHQVTPGSN